MLNAALINLNACVCVLQTTVPSSKYALKYMAYMFAIPRVMKQALRPGGANMTENHIKEVSLAAMFLTKAAKKANKEFGVHAVTQPEKQKRI